jgi:tight adherence protein C
LSAAGLLIVISALCLAAGLREWAELRRRRGSGGGRRRIGGRIPAWMSAIPALDREASSERLVRAGAIERLGLRGLVSARLGTAAAGGLIGLLIGPYLPGRASPVVGFLAILGGLVAPDLLLERRARRRRARIVAALAPAIDVLSVGVSGGHGVRSLFIGLAADGQGPLAEELALTVAELEAGLPTAKALANLRGRIPAPEIAQLTLAIERSLLLGSPLAAELDRQAATLRETQTREVTERAARASPKIQLVIALVLVPSVLLLVAAALAANSGRLLGAF